MFLKEPWLRRRVRSADVGRLHEIRVTSPVRTALDLAGDLPPDQALPWLERLRDDAGLDPADVVARIGPLSAPARRLIRAWAAG